MRNRVVSLFLFGALFTAVLAAQHYPWLPSKNPPPELPEILVTEAWLAANLDRPDLAVLDLRSAEDYGAGHVAGALQVPSLTAGMIPEIEGLRRRLGESGLSGRETLVLCCGASSAASLGRAFWLLEWAGYEDVRVFGGSLDAWRSAGHAVETRSSQGAPVAFLATSRPAVVADLEWLLEHYGRPGTQVLDLRDAVDWTRTDYATPTRFGAGHIPHSLPYDFLGLLPEDGSWPKPAAARQRLAALGVRPSDHVDLNATFVLAGRDGEEPQLGLGYLLLRLMAVEARVFLGGWEAWRSHGAPVVRIIDAVELRRLIEAGNPNLERDIAPSLRHFDTRSEAAFDRGHLPGARPLPAHLCGETFDQEAVEGLTEARAQAPVAFYCYGRDCIRSRSCATHAALSGLRSLLWFRGGEPAWRAAGYPFFTSLGDR